MPQPRNDNGGLRQEQRVDARKRARVGGAHGPVKRRANAQDERVERKGGDDDGPAAIVKIGPSEAVKLFDEFYDDYTKVWVGRNESDNYK